MNERSLQPKIRRVAAADRARKPRKNASDNEDTEQQVRLDQCVLRDGCYTAALRPTSTHPGPTYRR